MRALRRRALTPRELALLRTMRTGGQLRCVEFHGLCDGPTDETRLVRVIQDALGFGDPKKSSSLRRPLHQVTLVNSAAPRYRLDPHATQWSDSVRVLVSVDGPFDTRDIQRAWHRGRNRANTATATMTVLMPRFDPHACKDPPAQGHDRHCLHRLLAAVLPRVCHAGLLDASVTDVRVHTLRGTARDTVYYRVWHVQATVLLRRAISVQQDVRTVSTAELLAVRVLVPTM